ncbi:MAG: hypothetical protein AABZ00_03025 [Chloroflexota bacterium]
MNKNKNDMVQFLMQLAFALSVKLGFETTFIITTFSQRNPSRRVENRTTCGREAVKSVLRLFDELVKCDEKGILKGVREVVAGG